MDIAFISSYFTEGYTEATYFGWQLAPQLLVIKIKVKCLIIYNYS